MNKNSGTSEHVKSFLIGRVYKSPLKERSKNRVLNTFSLILTDNEQNNISWKRDQIHTTIFHLSKIPLKFNFISPRYNNYSSMASTNVTRNKTNNKSHEKPNLM